MKGRLIRVGRVAGGFGVKGEIRITAETTDPRALLALKSLLHEDGSPALTLTSGRASKGALIARAEGVADKDAADALRGLRLFAARDAFPPEGEDEFYVADLIGLAAMGEDGAVVGKIKAVHDFGAGDILEIAPEGGGATLLVPFTRAAVPQVDLAGGTVTVVPLQEDK